MEMCILASGSAGNCTIVRCPTGVMLIDVGIGPRVTAKRMGGTGVCTADVKAICLTHLDRDHFCGNWLASIVRHGIAVYCHCQRVDELMAIAEVRERTASERHPFSARQFAQLLHTFDGRRFEPLEGLRVQPITLAHDTLGSHGFLMEGFGCRLGYATDLGHVPADLIERFEAVDILALESNYDPEMELRSARPCFLKQRIMSGSGHLSNSQALDAVRRILRRRERKGLPPPEHIVLLHRSRECNCPKLLRKLFSQDERIGPRLTLAEQYQPSEWIRPRHVRPASGEQLAMFG